MSKQLLHIAKYLGGLQLMRSYKVATESIVVLCFHRINDTYDPFFPSLKPKIFDQLMRYVKKNFEVITLREMSKLQGKKPKLIITFDDGYKDFIEYAVPVLDDLKLPSTHAIVYDCTENGNPIWTQSFLDVFKQLLETSKNRCRIKTSIGEFHIDNSFKALNKVAKHILSHLFKTDTIKRNQFINNLYEQFHLEKLDNEMMNWDEINQCISADVEIANHSFSHEPLSLSLSDEQLSKEVVESKSKIEAKINRTIETFAFPNGLYNDASLSCCSKHYNYLLKLDDRFERNRSLPLVSRLAIYQKNLIENQFRVEGFYNMIKAPYRLFKK